MKILLITKTPENEDRFYTNSSTMNKVYAYVEILGYKINDLMINDLRYCSYNHIAKDLENIMTDLGVETIISMGNMADKELTKLNIPHFKLPDPRSKSKKLKDEKYMMNLLTTIKNTIESKRKNS